MTTEQQRVLNPADPADAVQIIDQTIGALRMDGLNGAQVAAIIASVNTLRGAVGELAELEKAANG